jgi:hypothetical protein
MGRRCRGIGAILSIALLLTLGPLAARGQPSRAELLKRSSVVFIGTVEGVGVVSFAGVPASPSTLVVRVDELLEKPTAVTLIPGDRVTVAVQDPSPFRQGIQATFYTEGWIVGEGIALQEVGHEISPVALEAGAVGQTREELAQMRKDLTEAELRNTVQAADVIVVGRVKEVRLGTMAAVGAPPKPITEHDPDWHEAVIEVESEIKGAQAGQEIVVRFPASLDVAWHDVPKLKVGQEGTFLLQRDQVSGTPRALLAGTQVDAYTALNPQDVLPKEEAQRIRALATP